MNPIIFLDIDGVLNTRQHLRRQKIETGSMDNRNWSPRACRHLALLCEQYGARIVLSSTWRYDHSEEELRALFERNELDPGLLAGVTPSLLHETEGRVRRGDEIRAWLEAEGRGGGKPNYLIIDDAPPSEFLEEQQERLLPMNPAVGFSRKEDALRAARMLDAG